MVFKFFKNKKKTNNVNSDYEQSLEAKVDALFRSHILGFPRPDGYVGSPVSHIKNPPFRAAEIWVKQIKWDSLTLIGRAALDTAFSGYADIPKNDERTPYEELMASKGFQYKEKSKGMARRYAGDHTLLRGAYYSLCNETGDDKGTLIGELRAYYSPDQVGVVQMYDCTLPADLAANGDNIANPMQLVFKFLPIGDSDNPFIEKFSDIIGHPEAQETFGKFVFSVGLPLKITKIFRKNVLDLRHPQVAEWFVNVLSNLTWQLGENDDQIPCYPSRNPLYKIEQLLPEMLAQEYGGGGLCMATGLLLRYLGADGLIFPSARNDVNVIIENGHVVSGSGWNFLDYYDSPSPEMLCWTEYGNQWPIHVGFRPSVNSADWAEPIWYPEVTISSDAFGSWQVHGLRNRTNLRWRINLSQYALKTIQKILSENCHSLLYGLPDLLKDCGQIDLAGFTSKLIFEAVLGDPQSISSLKNLSQSFSPNFKENFSKAVDELNEKVVLIEKDKLREIHIIWQGEDIDSDGAVGFVPPFNQ